jgi:hypothetical protein
MCEEDGEREIVLRRWLRVPLSILEGVSFVINEIFYTNFTVVCCMFIHILLYEVGCG